ncbi:8-oxo-dGTP diphosphatase MutT [Affinibrenneria salicis]|uniref:8-oxo-dGTP diphosphatase n=1 Tax=Affinibrenneria salicis TaxID=2590031 RepID=A0A5J5G727_9GAMM|nr:8-oxo-dGTP diphosphatase MutT [Affinibrenneria salicis]KAA9002592.1 8-oxo-dGTP diphosphatase MutT [Affinibrenneria salicis]KAA9003120.1 8-oxo-dGTP diphosphatase MutT [Affinibrenneria salicis]
MTQKQLSVAVGIIRNSEQRYFITRRPQGVHMGGMWEFPGGKVEEGETPEQGLIRELQEETGITALQPHFLESKQVDVPGRLITLHFFLVERWQGEPWGREGQPMRWLPVDELQEDEFPPANADIIRRLKSSR